MNECAEKEIEYKKKDCEGCKYDYIATSEDKYFSHTLPCRSCKRIAVDYYIKSDWIFVRNGDSNDKLKSKIWKCSKCGLTIRWFGNKPPEIECGFCKYKSGNHDV